MPAIKLLNSSFVDNEEWQKTTTRGSCVVGRERVVLLRERNKTRDITTLARLCPLTRDPQPFCSFCIISTKFSQSVDKSFALYDVISFSFLSELPLVSSDDQTMI